MDTLVQWELFDQGGVALSCDKEIAGTGVTFLYVDDVAITAFFAGMIASWCFQGTLADAWRRKGLAPSVEALLSIY